MGCARVHARVRVERWQIEGKSVCVRMRPDVSPPHFSSLHPFSPLRAEVRLDGARGELQRYYDRVSSNRMLVLKLLSILVAFVVFFSVFLV